MDPGDWHTTLDLLVHSPGRRSIKDLSGFYITLSYWPTHYTIEMILVLKSMNDRITRRRRYSVEFSLLFSGSPIKQFNANLITCQVFRDNSSFEHSLRSLASKDQSSSCTLIVLQTETLRHATY